MSLQSLKKSFSKFEECHAADPLFHLKGTHAHNLVRELAKFIIEECETPAEHCRQPQVPTIVNEPYITLMEFYDRTHLCHPSTIGKMFNKDDWFFHRCGKRVGNKFFIQEVEALTYLSTCKNPRIKSKAQRIMLERASARFE